jgi:ribosomal RNA-processing protein 17
MFARPRPKKSILPPRKRKTTHSIEEISFDDAGRQEYLTGFHKRKVQRVKRAQEEAAKKEKLEKLETRKQVSQREIRDRDWRGEQTGPPVVWSCGSWRMLT